VAATFDTPLPLPELQWKTFERFCVSLLQCLHPEAEIHLYGGEGHNQFGIDLRETLENPSHPRENSRVSAGAD
jgi:hypothetical protein